MILVDDIDLGFDACFDSVIEFFRQLFDISLVYDKSSH